MSQPTIDDNLSLDESLNIIFNGTQTLMETNNLLSQQSGREIEGRYEIDTDDVNIALFAEQCFQYLFDDSQSIDQFPLTNLDVDSIQNYLVGNTEVLPSTESNDIDEPIQSARDEQLAMIRTANSSLPINQPQNEKLRTKIPSDQSISLSRSVAVTTPAPNSLQLMYPLEDTYRSRYKSDYFPSKGNVRRPRYVADNAGHHYVSLQMPTEYPRDLKNEYVRVALLTIPFDGQGHFYSPYKFQQDHNEMKIPDENPIYVRVDETSGVMKLHLVLIKSKLDQLNHAQPLKPFSDTVSNIQNIISQNKLAPKDLINKYQLDKSHIAFTLCTKSFDGSYEVHPETTTISTTITEVQNKPTLNSKSTQDEEPTVNTEKKVSCPHCSHCFDLSEAEIKQNGHKRSVTTKSSTNRQSNKKKKMD